MARNVIPRRYHHDVAKPRKYTDDQLRQIVPTVYSVAQLLSALGLRAASGNYFTVQRRMKELNLDTSHFKGRGWLKGLKFQARKPIPLADILVDGSIYKSYALKVRLIESGLKRARCEECGITMWRGRPAPPRVGSHQREKRRQPARESAHRMPELSRFNIYIPREKQEKRLAPVAQPAEARHLKCRQCAFESHRGHHCCHIQTMPRKEPRTPRCTRLHASPSLINTDPGRLMPHSMVSFMA